MPARSLPPSTPHCLRPSPILAASAAGITASVGTAAAVGIGLAVVAADAATTGTTAAALVTAVLLPGDVVSTSVTVTATTGASVAGAGTFVAVASGFAIGGAILSIGMIVLSKAIVTGAITGDWELGFEYALGSPGDTSGVNFAVLFTGGGPEEDDENQPPSHVAPPRPGNEGVDGNAAGPGVWGTTSQVNRSIVAEGTTIQRHRSRQEIRNAPYPRFQYSESTTKLNQDDVVGSTQSDGKNLIGIANVGFVADLHGTSNSPLDPRLNTTTNAHGGFAPAISLLPYSPARQAITIPNQERSQNEYLWNGVADIGAWGGPGNRPVAAFNDFFAVPENSEITITFPQLTANDVDPDNDPLHVLTTEFPVENGVTQFRTIVDDQTGETTFAGFKYTPNRNFTGREVIPYLVTDSQFSNDATITIDVVSTNSRPDFSATDIFVEPNSGPHSIPNWATFDPGDPQESEQNVREYRVSNVSRPGLFTVQPHVTPDGTMHFELAPDRAGSADFDIVVQDDGGVQFDGVDTSYVKRMRIEVGDANNPPSFTVTQSTIQINEGRVVFIPNWATFDPGDVTEQGQKPQYHVKVFEPDKFLTAPWVDPSGALRFEFTPDYFGGTQIDVAVQDDGGNRWFRKRYITGPAHHPVGQPGERRTGSNRG